MSFDAIKLLLKIFIVTHDGGQRLVSGAWHSADVNPSTLISKQPGRHRSTSLDELHTCLKLCSPTEDFADMNSLNCWPRQIKQYKGLMFYSSKSIFPLPLLPFIVVGGYCQPNYFFDRTVPATCTTFFPIHNSISVTMRTRVFVTCIFVTILCLTLNVTSSQPYAPSFCCITDANCGLQS